MSNNAFLKLLRQYASLTRRLGAVYTEAVTAVVDQRKEAIERSGLPPDQLKAALADVDATAKREYPFSD